ncbi:MAG: AarF/ABC1/UbiB kinase family protein [Pirellulales bacterium]|nr:AarF/ABC1/UbiB kinase family protein [Pirellulales bacterium]
MKISTIPQIYRNVNRWGEILSILSKYGLAGWISRFDLSFAKGLFKNRDGEALANLTREQRIRLALAELGPTFVKLGQILSTRPDQVGLALAEELAQLQDHVPADSENQVRETIERELDHPVDALFRGFSPVPLASASIGQVHTARLPSGEEVVVKVQHQGIERIVHVDLDILLGLAQLAERLPEFSLYRPRETLTEFRRVLQRELDFAREERNLRQFARDFAGNPRVRIPKSYPQLSSSRVLTMERLVGRTAAELSEAMKTDRQAAIESAELAKHGAAMYLDMIFRNGFYHADPHPGNLLIMPNCVIGLLDFGMVGRIEETLREDIEDLLAAMVTQDSGQLTSLVMRLGATPTGMDEVALGVDLADFVANFGHQPLASFDLSGALTEMTEIIRRYHIVLPSPIGMLLKVLVMLEGTGRMLHPTFSLMEVLEPYQRRMMLRRLSPARQAKKIRRITREIEQLAELFPRRLREILQQVQAGKFDVHLDHRGLEPSVNRLVFGMLTSALFLGSALLISRDVWAWRGISIPGALGFLISGILGLRLLRAISKSGHLDRRK